MWPYLTFELDPPQLGSHHQILCEPVPETCVGGVFVWFKIKTPSSQKVAHNKIRNWCSHCKFPSVHLLFTAALLQQLDVSQPTVSVAGRVTEDLTDVSIRPRVKQLWQEAYSEVLRNTAQQHIDKTDMSGQAD